MTDAGQWMAEKAKIICRLPQWGGHNNINFYLFSLVLNLVSIDGKKFLTILHVYKWNCF